MSVKLLLEFESLKQLSNNSKSRSLLVAPISNIPRIGTQVGIIQSKVVRASIIVYQTRDLPVSSESFPAPSFQGELIQLHIILILLQRRPEEFKLHRQVEKPSRCGPPSETLRQEIPSEALLGERLSYSQVRSKSRQRFFYYFRLPEATEPDLHTDRMDAIMDGLPFFKKCRLLSVLQCQQIRQPLPSCSGVDMDVCVLVMAKPVGTRLQRHGIISSTSMFTGVDAYL